MSLDSPFIIGIAGPSGSGKTTVSRRLGASLGARVLSLESYYYDLSGLTLEERTRRNFDMPDALDAKLLVQHVKSFSRGEDVQVPVYDFGEHARVPNRTEIVRSGSVLIVEGILVLTWPELRSTFDVSFYLDAADEVCFQRRLVRDIVERQRTHEFVKLQYQETVLPMAIRYVYPTKAYADIVVDATQEVAAVEAQILSGIHSRRRSVANDPASRGPYAQR